MTENGRGNAKGASPAAGTVKVVAEMAGDEQMREKLDEMKKNDGYPESCGILKR
jgi:hypothetical protein